MGVRMATSEYCTRRTSSLLPSFLLRLLLPFFFIYLSIHLSVSFFLFFFSFFLSLIVRTFLASTGYTSDATDNGIWVMTCRLSDLDALTMQAELGSRQLESSGADEELPVGSVLLRGEACRQLQAASASHTGPQGTV